MYVCMYAGFRPMRMYVGMCVVYFTSVGIFCLVAVTMLV